MMRTSRFVKGMGIDYGRMVARFDPQACLSADVASPEKLVNVSVPTLLLAGL